MNNQIGVGSVLLKEYMNGYNVGFSDGFKEGRKDTITECLQIVQKIKDDYNDARFGEQVPINYGTLCGIIIAFEQLKEQENDRAD